MGGGEGRERKFQAEERQPLNCHHQVQCSGAAVSTHTIRTPRVYTLALETSWGKTRDTAPRSENSTESDSRGPTEEASPP